MNTNAYNHVTLGTAELPLIPNIEYKRLIEAIQEGEKGLVEAALLRYTFEANQLQIAQSLERQVL